MITRTKITFLVPLVLITLIITNLKAEEKIEAVIDQIQIISKDLKTLEKAVYSGSENIKTRNISSNNLNEDVLTKHLLKLNEIEAQFQELTNKFEEINFKLDKLSNKLSKVQQDNQLRFKQIEQTSIINSNNNSLSSLPKTNQTLMNEELTQKKILPGSSEPQSLGEVSYKDMTTSDDTQVIESVEQTEAIISEVFNAEEKLLPDASPKEQYQFARNFLKVGDYTLSLIHI